MAKREELKSILETFSGLDGKTSPDVFRDIVIVETENNRERNTTLLNCKNRSVRGYVWKYALEIINERFYYYGMEVSPATSEQLKTALFSVFGVDYKELLKPIIEYFLNVREENKK